MSGDTEELAAAETVASDQSASSGASPAQKTFTSWVIAVITWFYPRSRRARDVPQPPPPFICVNPANPEWFLPASVLPAQPERKHVPASALESLERDLNDVNWRPSQLSRCITDEQRAPVMQQALSAVGAAKKRVKAALRPACSLVSGLTSPVLHMLFFVRTVFV